jgi:ribbon-helix-helix CopG family protein
MASLSCTVTPELKERLAQLANRQRRSVSFAMAEAIEFYLDHHEQDAERPAPAPPTTTAPQEPTKAPPAPDEPVSLRNIDPMAPGDESIENRIQKLYAQRDDKTTYLGLTVPETRKLFQELDDQIKRLETERDLAENLQRFERPNDGS